ncbi:MAG TPA: hypothetical protein VKB86_06910 [Pyrinomonadaceae bacterium]|nr:hypothetical protein [Pyrinomonadaceae bacterium]
MRRLTFYLAVAIGTFSLGVGFALLWAISHHPTSNVFPIEKVNQAIPLPQKRVYESGGIYCGFVGRYRVSSNQLESSDGMQFSITRIFYNSPKEANKELLLSLEGASNIVKREPVLDNKGHQIGEKVVATFPPREGGSVTFYTQLLWTQGKDFGLVSSTSLENILKYDKDHNQ